jgi:TATA-box binding protein (TBP) (component of TFIID and TFIIIB)
MTFRPEPYKISTITATGSINTSINLDNFFATSCIDDDKIIYMEFGTKKSHVTESKGERIKVAPKMRKDKERKRFDNQVTILCKPSPDKVINMKLFKNGNVQMTGIKDVSQGVLAVDILVNHIKKTVAKYPEEQIVTDLELLTNTNFKVHLINSDFRTGIKINRNKINTLLQEEYNIYSCFEPTIYPGVKVQYFWQKNKGDTCGACNCAVPCMGKGDGTMEGDCKKITIAIFQSGCLIITGARDTLQIDDAYKFICRVIQKHLDHIIKIDFILPQPPNSALTQ